MVSCLMDGAEGLFCTVVDFRVSGYCDVLGDLGPCLGYRPGDTAPGFAVSRYLLFEPF